MSEVPFGTYPGTHAVNAVEIDPRAWRFDMENAPRDRVVEVVGRLRHATAGFPQYSIWWEEHQAFMTTTYDPPLRPLICWAWRERTDWPQEPIGTPISELSGRLGHDGYDRFLSISESWGHP